MVGLTARQADMLRFLTGFVEAHGWAPTYAEICEGFGSRSKSCVNRLLNGLEERGAIRRSRAASRCIEIVAEMPIARAPDGAPLRSVRLSALEGSEA